MNYYENIEKATLRYKIVVAKYIDDNDYWGWHNSRLDRSEAVELLKFIYTILSECLIQEMPLTKLNRWLGYVQGMLIAAKLTTVEAERDWTRPLFRPLDYPCKVDGLS